MRATDTYVCLDGQPWPMGATPMSWQGQDGVNFAVHAPHAEGIECCLFDENCHEQKASLPLPRCTDGVWHGFVPQLGVGQLYGLRASGPYAPDAGHRFNRNKLLVDPYAKELVGSRANLAREVDYNLDPSGQRTADTQDNAGRIPKTRVIDSTLELRLGAGVAPGPSIPLSQMILYEAHVRGLTKCHPKVDPPLRGTYAAVCSPPMLEHFKRLGITSICLMPVQLHVSERHLLDLGLVNYWGYNTLGFFVPETSYSSHESGDLVRAEFRDMVDTLHRNGLEVLLDVVYNHTAEGDANGPTLCLRGLNNAGAYAQDDGGSYQNHTGCGNSLNFGEPQMVQLVMDSLRWWVQAFGVDGFRFDLATTLGRDPALQHRFNPSGALMTAISQDPVLCSVKRIAEPWDIGADGYQLGGFAPGWLEWNDQFRDTARAYWLGHACSRGQFACRLAGSSDIFRQRGRSPLASINLITSHDGFTLADLTSYNERRNHANGENNRDGHSHNLSANGGIEGATDDHDVLKQRGLWQRALLGTLFVAQGSPQLLAGDEFGHSQHGNNNAYCQDNAGSWLDWEKADAGLIDFVAGLIALRSRYPALRHPDWFDGVPKQHKGEHEGAGRDITWLNPDGLTLCAEEWHDSTRLGLACLIEVGQGQRPAQHRIMLIFNPAATPVRFTLPQGRWRLELNTALALFSGAEDFSLYCDADQNTLIVLSQDIKAVAQV